MLTFTTLKSTYATYTDDSDSNETVGAASINDSIRTICNLQGGKLRFLEGTKSMYTVASQESYQIPNGFRKLIDLYIYSGSGSSSDTIYSPEMIFDPTKWKLIKQFRYGTSDVPYFTYVENQKFYIQPIPSTDGQLITLRGRKNIRDLTIEDYSTGTITSVPRTDTFTAILASGAVSGTLTGNWALPTDTYQILFSNGEYRPATFTNGSTAVTWSTALESAATASITVNAEDGGSIVTASGTTFTADMVGRYIMITNTTAANGGDGFWYEIGGYISATVISLLKPYEGTAIAAGSATYTIGQVPIIPEAYQLAIVYRAVALYWENKEEVNKAKVYWLKYDGGNEAGYNTSYGGLIGQMLDNEGETEEGAYVPPFGSTSNMVSPAPYYYPWQQASGF